MQAARNQALLCASREPPGDKETIQLKKSHLQHHEPIGVANFNAATSRTKQGAEHCPQHYGLESIDRSPAALSRA
jgi:hypothetical protein